MERKCKICIEGRKEFEGSKEVRGNVCLKGRNERK